MGFVCDLEKVSFHGVFFCQITKVTLISENKMSSRDEENVLDRKENSETNVPV